MFNLRFFRALLPLARGVRSVKKPQFETSNVGVEFTDAKQVANKDDKVLAAMVNANIGKDPSTGKKG
jgi:hypothetical protein